MFVKTNRRAIAIMFVRLSVCLSGTGVHCDHTVQFNADLSLWLDLGNLTPKYINLLPAVFLQFHLKERLSMDQTRVNYIYANYN